MARYRTQKDSYRVRKNRKQPKSNHLVQADDTECLDGPIKGVPYLQNVDMDQIPPRRIMGRSLHSWTKEKLHRVMQAYDISWTKKMKKQDLAVILGQYANKHNLSNLDRENVLSGEVDENTPYRYQELDIEGKPKPSAFPRGFHDFWEMMDPNIQSKRQEEAYQKIIEGYRESLSQVTEDENQQQCVRCSLSRSEFSFPNEVSTRCDHPVVWCRSCLSKEMRRQLEDPATEFVQCPICTRDLDAAEVKPIISKTVFAK